MLHRVQVLLNFLSHSMYAEAPCSGEREDFCQGSFVMLLTSYHFGDARAIQQELYLLSLIRTLENAPNYGFCIFTKVSSLMEKIVHLLSGLCE